MSKSFGFGGLFSIPPPTPGSTEKRRRSSEKKGMFSFAVFSSRAQVAELIGKSGGRRFTGGEGGMEQSQGIRGGLFSWPRG